jgi:hypothetical protein
VANDEKNRLQKISRYCLFMVSYLVIYPEHIGDVDPNIDDVHLAVKGQVKLVVVSEKEL